MMMAMRFVTILTMILILGLSAAGAAERPVVTIATTGYGLIEECPAEGPRDLCYNEHISIPVRISIGEEIEVDLSQVGVVIEYYINALWYDADQRSCRATNKTLNHDNVTLVLVIDFCEVVN